MSRRFDFIAYAGHESSVRVETKEKELIIMNSAANVSFVGDGHTFGSQEFREKVSECCLRAK